MEIDIDDDSESATKEKTKTITLRPTALWYTEEIRSETAGPFRSLPQSNGIIFP